MSFSELDTLNPSPYSTNCTSFQQDSRWSFDTILSSHANISYRKRNSSILPNIYKSVNRFYNFEITRSNSTLLSWCQKLLKDDDTFIAYMSSTASIVACVQTMLFFLGNYYEDTVVIYLRSVYVVLSACTCIWLIRRYKMLVNIGILKCHYSATDTVFTIGSWKMASLEIFLNVLGPYPYLNQTFTVDMLDFEVEYSIESIFTFLSVMRLYLLARLLLHHSCLSEPRAEQILLMNGAEPSSLFAIKCYMKSYPFVSIGLFFTLMSLVCAVCMMLCERADRVYTDEYVDRFGSEKYLESNLATFYENIWLVIVTSTGVGYGDLVPVTHLGKTVALLTCIFCSVYIGLLISAVHHLVAHKPKEFLAYSLLKRHAISEDLKKNYRQLVGCALLFVRNKDTRLVGNMRRCLMNIHMKIGAVGDIPQSDISYAKRLIDQTSDLACITQSLQSVKAITCTLQISKSISILRDLISDYGTANDNKILPRRELRFSQLRNYPIKFEKIQEIEDETQDEFLASDESVSSDSSDEIFPYSCINAPDSSDEIFPYSCINAPGSSDEIFPYSCINAPDSPADQSDSGSVSFRGCISTGYIFLNSGSLEGF